MFNEFVVTLSPNLRRVAARRANITRAVQRTEGTERPSVVRAQLDRAPERDAQHVFRAPPLHVSGIHHHLFHPTSLIQLHHLYQPKNVGCRLLEIGLPQGSPKRPDQRHATTRSSDFNQVIAPSSGITVTGCSGRWLHSRTF